MSLRVRAQSSWQGVLRSWPEIMLVFLGAAWGFLAASINSTKLQWISFVILSACSGVAAESLSRQRTVFRLLVDQAAAPRDNTGKGFFDLRIWIRDARCALAWPEGSETSVETENGRGPVN